MKNGIGLKELERRLAKLEPNTESDYITIVELADTPEKCRTYKRRATPEEKQREKENGGVYVVLDDFNERETE